MGKPRHPFSQLAQLLSRVRLFATPWTAACQASLSITNSRSLLKLTSVDSVMPSNHLILCHPLLLLPSIFPSIRVFSKESILHIRWPKYWSFSFSISPGNEYSGLISFRIDVVFILLLEQNHMKRHAFLLRKAPLRPVQPTVASPLWLLRAVPWSGCAVTGGLTGYLLKDFGVIFSSGLL